MDPDAPPPATPSFDLSGLAEGIGQAVWSLFEGGVPLLASKLVAASFGAVATFLWDAAGGALAQVNVFTQLPPAWSYELRPVVEMRGVMDPLGRAVLALSLVLAVLIMGAGLITGRPFGAVLTALPRIFLAAAGMLFSGPLVRWWIDFSNAASARLLDPRAGLPGLDQVQGMDHFAALGVVALVYLFCGLWLFLGRIVLVVLVCLLVVTAPLAIASGALPFAPAQRFFGWWLTTFLGATFVQVLQAVCLALGGALIGRSGVTGTSSADAVMSVALGVGAIAAAMKVPGMLLGSLARSSVLPGLLDAAFRVGMLASGVGAAAAGVATVTGVASAARGAGAVASVTRVASVQAVPQMGGYTQSLLGGRAQLLLPAPRG